MTPEDENKAIAGAARAFRAANPDYRRSTKTLTALIEFMDENNLAKTEAASWQKSYDAICRDEVGYSTGKFLADGRPELYMGREAIDHLPADELRESLKDEKFARGANLILGDEK